MNGFRTTILLALLTALVVWIETANMLVRLAMVRMEGPPRERSLFEFSTE